MDSINLAAELEEKLNRPVNSALIERIKTFASESDSQDLFTSKCLVFGRFDKSYLSELYNRLRGATNGSSGLSKSAQDKLAAIRAKRLATSQTAEKARETRPHYNGEPPQSDYRTRTPTPTATATLTSTPTPIPTPVLTESDVEVDLETERKWYMQDELAGAEMNYQEDDLEPLQAIKNKRISRQAVQRNEERAKWEQGQLSRAGLANPDHKRGWNMNENDGDETKTYIYTHALCPPFLEDYKQGPFSQGGIGASVSAVRDPDGPLGQNARKGSQLVLERRKLRERRTQAKEAVSIKGSMLGKVLKNETQDAEDKQSSQNKSTSGNSNAGYKIAQGSKSYKELQEQRRQLPAFRMRSQFLDRVRENQIIIVVGETGSGKTTQLAQFLYEEGYTSHGQVIGVTQPRRVAAVSVATRVASEMGCELGTKVGYAIRFESRTAKDTKIKYMTEGILVSEALLDPDLSKYSCIIMDEAHERSVNTDVLLGLFRRLLTRRRDLKLIVTSATLNSERFSTFFGGAPSVTIPGRTFPVQVFHSSGPVGDYVDAAVKQVLKTHIQGPLATDTESHDILVFMTGQEDIEAVCEALEDKMKLLDQPAPLLILPIYSQMPQDLQSRIFEPTPEGARKVVVATNIAETSLTLDGIRYVVDCGYSKMKVYNSRLGMDALQLVPIARSSAAQRSGRAGRTAPGTAYRLYTETAEIEEMYAQPVPEIQRTNLANTVLLLKSLKLDPFKFNFLDVPSKDLLNSSLYTLWTLGALDNMGELTKTGLKMASLPIDPTLSRLIVDSLEYQCVDQIVTIVAMLSSPPVFYRPNEQEQQTQSDIAREKFFVAESDHLTLLQVYNQWVRHGQRDSWSRKHFLHGGALRHAQQVREQLLTMIGRKQITQSAMNDVEQWDNVRRCICNSFFHQAARTKSLTEYVNLRTAMVMSVHPTSALYGLAGLPEYVVYHELVMTGANKQVTKQYMKVVTAVDAQWLLDTGAIFYRDNSGLSTRYIELEAELAKDMDLYKQRQETKKRQFSNKEDQEESGTSALTKTTTKRRRRRGL